MFSYMILLLKACVEKKTSETWLKIALAVNLGIHLGVVFLACIFIYQLRTDWRNSLREISTLI